MNTILLAALLHLPTSAYPLHIQAPAAQIDIATDKIASVVGMVNDDAARDFSTEYAITAGLPGDRVIFIDSPGGSVTAGQVIIDTMEAEKKSGVRQVCVVSHEASSMAFNILTHCDVRLALPRSRMLVHKAARFEVDCRLMRCTAANLRALSDEIRRVDAPYRAANAQALGLRLEDYDRLADAETTWTVQQLLDRGYLHSIAKLAK